VYLFCTGKLLEFTGLTAEFNSGLDLVYLADCLYNCVLCTGKLLEFTGLTAEFKSGLDLVYLADCLYNCLLCTGMLIEFTVLTAEFQSGLALFYLADCLYNCAGKLLEFTGLTAEFKSGLDLVYLADCLENYVPLLPANPVLAEILGKYRPNLKVHMIEIFFGFDFEICIISLFGGGTIFPRSPRTTQNEKSF
jgi:predicted metal-binding protein